ncbi:MAG: MlaD family protein [Melioribacteraceae bacterium]|nr:MlaD family protein [Melioribacteraceae bacterium]MDD3557710.1 MlaD family protein [Melioribacteraceae bacterium]
MEEQKKTEIKVGITVLAGIIVFVLVLMWAKNISVFSDKQLVKIEFPQVPGLEIGDLVTVYGVRSGHVEDLTISESGVLVSISIDENIELKSDALFSITMLDLMGGKKIEISPGIATQTLDYSKIQKGYFYGDITSVMSLFHNVEADLVSVVKEVKAALEGVNTLLADGTLGENINDNLIQVSNLVSNLNGLISENKDELSDLIKNGNRLSTSAADLIEQNRDQIDSLFISINNTTFNLDALIKNADDLITETKSSNNNLGKIIYNDSLLVDLKNMLDQTNSLMKIVLEQLKGDGLNVDANIF